MLKRVLLASIAIFAAAALLRIEPVYAQSSVGAPSIQGGIPCYQGGSCGFSNTFLTQGGHLNFGQAQGDSGYGIRDNGGVVQLKNSGQNWFTPLSVDGGVLTGATGGSQGAGTLNAAGIFINGSPVGGALTVPSATLLSGNGSALGSVSLGSGLSVPGGVLTLTLPTGTSGHVLPYLDQANTSSAPWHFGAQTVDGSAIAFTGGAIDGVSLGLTTAIPQMQIGNSGGFAHTSSTATVLNSVPFLTGSSASNPDAFYRFALSDGVNQSAGGLDAFRFVDSVTNITGNRNGGDFIVQVNSISPGDASLRNYTGMRSGATLAANAGGSGNSTTSGRGAIWGGLDSAVICSTCQGSALFGRELDVSAQVQPSVKNAIVASSSSGDAFSGKYVDAAFEVGKFNSSSVGWKNGFQIGSDLSDWPLTSDGAVISLHPRVYSGTQTAALQWGIDFRNIVPSADAWASPSSAIDGSGNFYANTITAIGTVQAKTATVTGATVVDGGVYPSVPTLAVAAPPSGSTATMAVATMSGNTIYSDWKNGFGATGYACTAGTMTLSGGTGTAPTWTSTVNGNGEITALSLAGGGSLTVAPANPATLTGGSCTSTPEIYVTYTQSGANFVASAVTFGATGKGFATNDTFTIAGDTGTAVVGTVDSVTGTGGITAAHVTTPGAVSAIAGGTYHTASATSASGLGGSWMIGYGIATVTETAGSGYGVAPAPLVTSSATAGKLAVITPTMTPANATLALNPSGGGLSMNGTAAVSCGSGTVSASTMVVTNGVVTHC